MTSDERSIGDYQLVASLGSGGMAHVHLAVSARAGGFQKLLVLKSLREEFAEDPEFRRMFLDEARIAARLNHPNVVHTYEVGEHAGKIFIAMEYLEGQAFSAVLNRVGRNEIPVNAGLRVLADALAGLHYAHELADFDGKAFGLVHRDVSPQNVFVTYMGHSKILDFGIAKGSLSAGQTRSGVIKGKVGYMAPEQVMGERLDRRADLFAVGVMLWELLAKTRFVGKSEEEVAVITRRIQGREKSIREAAPHAPSELLDICELAMAHDPAERFPSAAAMQERLEAYLAKEGGGEQRAVASLLELHFKEERSKVRRVVEEGVKSLDAGGPLATLKTSAHSVSSSSGSRSDVGSDSGSSRRSGAGSSAPAAETKSAEVPMLATTIAPSSRRASTPIVVGAAAFALVTALGGYFWFASRAVAPSPLPPQVAADTASTPSSSSAVAVSAPSVPASAPASVSSSRIVVTTVPKGAVLSLDGVAVVNPYEGTLSDGPHKLRAQAAGFRTTERVLTPKDSGDIVLNLEAVAHGEDPAPPSTSRPKKPKHAIDDTDPYK